MNVLRVVLRCRHMRRRLVLSCSAPCGCLACSALPNLFCSVLRHLHLQHTLSLNDAKSHIFVYQWLPIELNLYTSSTLRIAFRFTNSTSEDILLLLSGARSPKAKYKLPPKVYYFYASCFLTNLLYFTVVCSSIGLALV